MDDLVGRRFGKLVVLSQDKKDGRFPLCRCRCDCGREKEVRAYSLLSGNTTSCGCIRHKDITGERFGRLVALKYVGKSRWLCRCDCGKEKEIALRSLVTGRTRSCGCLADPARLLADRVDGTRIGSIQHGIRADNTSGVCGVSYNRRRGKYEAHIEFQGTKRHLGTFARLEDAAAARAKAEEELFAPVIDAYKKKNEK